MNYTLIFLMTLMMTMAAEAKIPLVIYGEDNRIDTVESQSPLFRKLAQSTAAMIANNQIVVRGSTAELHGKSLKERYDLCDKERFAQQPTVANCSGFLVAKNVIVTAGHCMELVADCKNYSWVFNYKVGHATDTSVSVATQDVYKCSSIIRQELNGVMDYALIKLDRAVTNYPIVKLAKTEPTIGTPLVLIGHPSGLPQKIADGAMILSQSTYGFTANLDAFSGNSGSAVFHAQTGDLVGILVNGSNDYNANGLLHCTEVNVLTNDKGEEGVSSFKQFAPYLN